MLLPSGYYYIRIGNYGINNLGICLKTVLPTPTCGMSRSKLIDLVDVLVEGQFS